MKSGFVEKLIERMDRLSRDEIQTQFIHMVRERGFLEKIINAVQEGVIVTDSEGIVRYLNQAVCAMFALDGGKAVGKPIADSIRGLDWEPLAQSDSSMIREMEVFYPQNRFVNFYLVPLEMDDDEQLAAEAPAYAIILRDVTETRKSTEETIESERLSALTLLAAGVAHEIGNPLNSLHIHMQLMERKLRRLPKSAQKSFQEAIEVSKEEISRLDFIVSQFLRAIRPSVIETQAENINDVVTESLDFLANEIKDRDILVERELHGSLPRVEVDRGQLKQVFYNLIRNSFQAMNSGGLLRVTTELEDDFVTVSFADNGGGISAEAMNQLFQPYFTTKTKGSGLGLLIVRRIVREHGGELAISNNEGKGLIVTIRLPLLDKRIRLLK